jgi:hypothetical protein
MGLAYPLSPNSEQSLRVVAIAPALIGLYESPSAPVKVTTNNSEIISNPPGGPFGGGELRLQCVGFNHDLGMGTAGTLLDVDPEIKSLDGVLMLSFPRFINVRQEGIGVLSTISVSSVAVSMPAPPLGALISAYEFGPKGVIFVPSSAATEGYPNTHVTLTMNYSDAQIPAGMSESSFYLAVWDGAEWVKLPASTPYATFNMVTARIAHTGTYALLAEAQPPVTTPPPPQTTLQPPQTMPPPTPPPTTSPFAITQDAAIGIARGMVPPNLKNTVNLSAVGTHFQEGYFDVKFEISPAVTLGELGWQEGPGTELENTGLLPVGTFRQLSFRIDGMTGDVILKKASDLYLPPRRAPVDEFWQRLPFILGGLVFIVVVGVWLIIMRRRTNR